MGRAVALFHTEGSIHLLAWLTVVSAPNYRFRKLHGGHNRRGRKLLYTFTLFFIDAEYQVIGVRDVPTKKRSVA